MTLTFRSHDNGHQCWDPAHCDQAHTRVTVFVFPWTSIPIDVPDTGN